MTSIPRNGAIATLAISGVIGFWIGLRCFPTWHVAVESAQVIAGLVQYPQDNPFYIYHLKIWTVMHELLALALRAGVSEIALSRFLSGALGMLSLQALALCSYALSRDVAYAVLCSVVIFLGGAGEFSGTYPIDLMGTTHTYGAIGLSAVVLTAGLLGSGAYRTGGLLLGFMPAIHPSIGIWGGTITAIALLTDWKKFSREFRPALPWFLAGCALTVVSLVAHLWNARGIPAATAASATQYLDTYVRLWDVHRRAPDIHDLAPYLSNPSVRMAFGVVPLGIAWLWSRRHRVPPAADFLVRFVVVTAAIAILVMFVLLMTGGWLPSFIQILMPLRILNIVGMMCAAVLFGAIASEARIAQLLAALLAAGLLIGDRSRLGIDRGRYPWMPQELSPLAVIGAIAFVLTAYAIYRRRAGVEAGSPLSRVFVWIRSAASAMVAAALLAYWIPWSIATEPVPLAFRDWRHDPVFSVAAKGRGLLATGDSLHLIQLKTRRPVLLDGGGIDGIVYSIDAAPAMERIVREVYGIDMFHPSEEEHRGAEPISAIVNQRNWQAYSREKWSAIRRAYNVTQVLTPARWQLDLPIAAETSELRLYEIPE